MSEERKCSKCGNKIGSANKSGICTPCQRPTRFGLAGVSLNLKRSDAGGKPRPTDDEEDAVLARVEASSVKPPPPPKVRRAKKEKPPPEAPGDVEEFFKLAEALGLDAQKMLDDWCRQWVARVRARALGARPSADAPAEIRDGQQEAPTNDAP